MFRRLTRQTRTIRHFLAGFDVEITFKKVRNINMRLRPGSDLVFVSAPHRVSLKEIASFIDAKRDWLLKNFAELKARVPEIPPSFMCGEVHFVWGRPLTLKRMKRRRKTDEPYYDLTHLYLPVSSENEPAEKCAATLQAWYKSEVERAVAQLQPYWERQMRVQIASLSYRSMKSRWGTCFISDAHIRLNTELAKRPPMCLEYVLVHEMVHFFESGHNARFYRLMDKFMPDWHRRRDALKAPLQLGLEAA